MGGGRGESESEWEGEQEAPRQKGGEGLSACVSSANRFELYLLLVFEAVESDEPSPNADCLLTARRTMAASVAEMKRRLEVEYRTTATSAERLA